MCVLERVHHITTTIRAIFDMAKRQDISTYRAAMRLTERKLEAVRQAKTHGAHAVFAAD